jgi:hypothetical protein
LYRLHSALILSIDGGIRRIYCWLSPEMLFCFSCCLRLPYYSCLRLLYY